MLRITPRLALPLDEIELIPIRAQGAGGQHLHKTSSAVQLRFDIRASSLPPACQQALLQSRSRQLSQDGVIVIKAQEHRSLEQNRAAALERLRRLIERAATPSKPRKATRPSRAARARRMDQKTRHGRVKQLRAKIAD